MPRDAAARRAPGRWGPGWARHLGRALARLLYRAGVHDAHRVPTTGPVLLAGNHTGFLDGPLLQGTSPRGIHFLVKSEMFRGPIGLVLRASGQIPVTREGIDRVGLDTALAVLARGGVVGVFPEGSRGRGEVSEVRAGIAWLALRSGAPVVPVACLGTRRTGQSVHGLPPPRSRVDVVFGDPVIVRAPSGVPGRVALAEAAGSVREVLAAHVAAAALRTGQALPDDAGWPDPGGAALDHRPEEPS